MRAFRWSLGITLLLTMAAVLVPLACARSPWGASTIAAASPAPEPATLGPGDHSLSLVHGGLRRTYRVHVPASYTGKTPTPLVLYIHGGEGNAHAAYLDGMDKASDRFGFILGIPEGTGSVKWGQLRAEWNGGRWSGGECCGTADDVGFVSQVIDAIELKANIDHRRVYATGISNGGLMTNRLGCEMANKIAAIATVAPAGLESSCRPSRPIPVLDIHGTGDRCNPFNGGTPPLGACAKVSYVRMTPKAVVDAWVRIDGCANTPTTTTRGKVTITQYAQCSGGAEVVFYRVEGMGHTWPSGSQYLPAFLVGPVSTDVSQADIWEFFDHHPMP